MVLGRDSEARFGQDFEVEVQARFAAGVCQFFSADVEILRLVLNKVDGQADVWLRF